MSLPWEDFEGGMAVAEPGPWTDFEGSKPDTSKPWEDFGGDPEPPADPFFQAAPPTTALNPRLGRVAPALAPIQPRVPGESLGLTKPLLQLPKVSRETMEWLMSMPAQTAQDISEMTPDDQGTPIADKIMQMVPSPKSVAITTGLQHAGADLGSFFTSPLGISTLGIGTLPKAVQSAVALAFSAQMAKDVPEIATQLGTEIGKPEDQRDYQKIAELTANGVAATGFSALGAAHGLGRPLAERLGAYPSEPPSPGASTTPPTVQPPSPPAESPAAPAQPPTAPTIQPTKSIVDDLIAQMQASQIRKPAEAPTPATVAPPPLPLPTRETLSKEPPTPIAEPAQNPSGELTPADLADQEKQFVETGDVPPTKLVEPEWTVEYQPPDRVSEIESEMMKLGGPGLVLSIQHEASNRRLNDEQYRSLLETWSAKHRAEALRNELLEKEQVARDVAKEIGATFKPVSAFSMEGVPPELAAEMEAIRKKTGWEFTPQPGSALPEGRTFYVPEGATREEILKRYQEKLDEEAKPAAAPAPTPALQRSDHPTEIVHEDKAGLHGSRYIWAVIDGHPWKIRIADHPAGMSSVAGMPEVARARTNALKRAATVPNENPFTLDWRTDDPGSVTLDDVARVVRRHVADEFYTHEDAKYGGEVDVNVAAKSPHTVEIEGDFKKEEAPESEASRTIPGSPKNAGNQIQTESRMVRSGENLPPVEKSVNGAVNRSPFWVRPRSDGITDILDDVQQLGGLRPPQGNAGGEYDGWKETMGQGPAKMLVRAKARHTPDTIINELHDLNNGQGWQRIQTPDDLYNEIAKSARERNNLRTKGGTPEEQSARFWSAVSDPKQRNGLERINAQNLKVGDTFRIRGPGISHEELTVTGVDADTGEVSVKDGPKLGRQDIPDGAQIWVQRGSHVDKRTGIVSYHEEATGKLWDDRKTSVTETSNDDGEGNVSWHYSGSGKASADVYGHNGKFYVNTDDGFGDQGEQVANSLEAAKATGRDFVETQNYEMNLKRISADENARAEIINTIDLPKGVSLGEIQDTKWGSVYYDIKHQTGVDADGEPEYDHYKVSIRDHEPSPFREKELGAVYAWFEVPKNPTPKQLSDAVGKIEKWAQKKFGSTTEPKHSIGSGIKAALERKGEAGSVRIPSKQELVDAWGDLPDHLRNLARGATDKWHGIVDRLKRGGEYDTISKLKDSAETMANTMGNQTAKFIVHELNRAFDVAPQRVAKERNALREMALTMTIEAEERGKLGEFRYMLEHAPLAPPIWKRRALKAIAFADANWDRLKPVAETYKLITDAENQYENANGIPTLHRKGGYVFHTQDLSKSGEIAASGGGGTGVATPFRKMRDHPTYAESIANGITPFSLNAADLLQRRISIGQKAVNMTDWVKTLEDIKDHLTALPVAVNPEWVERTGEVLPTHPELEAPGTPLSKETQGYWKVPPEYELQEFGGHQFGLHKGYTGLFTALTDPSHFQKSPAGRAFMQAVGTAKHTMLLFDSYHLGRLAMWNMFSRQGMPTFNRGLTLLDNTLPELKNMLARGEINPKFGKDLIQSKTDLDLLLKEGMNVGTVGDNLHTEFLKKINFLGTGTFNKLVFEKYQRGAMSEVGLIEMARLREAHPDWSDSQVARAAAKGVNTRFGNLQSQGWLKSKTGQDLARVLFLAPSWNESLIRSEIGAFKEAGQAVGNLARGRRPAMGLLARGVGTAMVGIFVGNQLINMATRGHPTWENEEEGFGAKISAWIPDAGGGPGFFLNPTAVPVEMAHLLMNNAEKHDWRFDQAALDMAKSRFSPLARGAWTFATSTTTQGQAVKPGSRISTTLSEMMPTPLSAGAAYRFGKQLVTGEHQESYPGQFEKSLMQSVGIKTEQAPDSGKRIYDLAKRFEASKGITEPMTRDVPFYGELSAAVKRGNLTDANDALDKILTLAKGNGDPHTLADVARFYGQYAKRNFTRNNALEAQFYQSLTEAQRAVYSKAMADKSAVAQKVGELLQDRAKAQGNPR